jgi:hypothetical protein
VAEEGMPWKLFLAAQILIGVVDPIGAWRIEYVKVDGVFHRFRFMRHVGGNAKHFARVHHNFLAVDPELQRTIENVGELLIMMAMLGHDAALFQQHASYHNLLTDHELPLQQRVQIFQRNRVPRDVLQLGLASRLFGDGTPPARFRASEFLEEALRVDVTLDFTFFAIGYLCPSLTPLRL